MNLPIITYRGAKSADRDWLFGLKRATMRNYVSAIFGWDDVEQQQWFEEKFDPGQIRIIQVDGVDAGQLKVERHELDVYLAQIEILPRFQNGGIGSHVIRSIVEDARKENKFVRLQVLRSNPARRLYERLGFSVQETTATHFKMKTTAGNQTSPATR